MTTQVINQNIIRVSSEYLEDIGFSNSYIIIDDEIAIIDTGVRNQSREILNAIQEIGRKPEDVKYIILSHGHPYVLGGLGWLKKKTNAEIIASKFTSNLMEDFDSALTISYGLSKNQNNYLRKKKFPIDFKKIEVDKIISNRSIIKIGNSKIVALQTNGHSAGHLCFWEPKSKTLFTGDELTNYPNSFTKFIIDRTGSFEYREFALDLFLELNPSIICQTRDIPLLESMISNYIKNIIEGHKLWIKSALDFIKTNKEVNTYEIESYVKKSLGIIWHENMERLENHSTIIMLLKYLEENGKIEQILSTELRKKEDALNLELSEWKISNKNMNNTTEIF
jgi:glyoxylase-like metal-dependent hydrolase (beta-lactamase superfamily II)